jgi:predicted RNA-binding Zn-ribbon protein involved in translation (DUF1610 family)
MNIGLPAFMPESYPGKESKTHMTDPLKVKERIARGDGSVAPHHLSANAKTGDHDPVSGEGKVEPHNRESEVTTSIDNEKLICPQCGHPTIHAEFPDQYEAWIKCSECGFFMGLSYEDWRHMENSHNINEKIKKLAIKRDLVKPYPGNVPGFTIP